ncbi:MAG: amidophosphoribosyltransferase [Schleiferiaceae bacterium]|jgi:amidophosphoribosyltransferase|nr:amidophosphoribosyltransferase [Schleiferiaceae bacterium]MDP4616189.1 amidophosphoribosyltransferase [Schleiferiaceae bacterium]MDP4759477.1 amidophosphoribosyltransferase [Schleiferiaceae bacterium]MDP4767573.1 amidophosphoribosyltransferase [Schleiferiaceae bacterium]MDP4876642.1 amidophosphoribosyltransferase [Schleiferiaceae bacterium]
MSDPIKHECGIAFVRLRKPLEYYVEKYGTAFYGLNKMYLLMEKQRNRGQDGAGLANIKLNMAPGTRYISRYRSVDTNSIGDIFGKVQKRIAEGIAGDASRLSDVPWLKENLPFTGEVFLGHLRYGTYGGNTIEACHPFLRQNNWPTRNLIVAGNFNMTNVDELFNELVELGQHPKEKADTVTIMEKIGHFLDEANDDLYYELKAEGYSKKEATAEIANRLDLADILRRASKKWDGGYAMAGMTGHGDSFVLRDPAGIRPAYYYYDDEIVVVASERPVIQSALNLKSEQITELPPGNALIVKHHGEVSIDEIKTPTAFKACSFERIYFSRGNDKDIYNERIELGRRLIPRIVDLVDGEVEDTVFSFIPNTAEVSFYGMVKGMEDHFNGLKYDRITALENPTNEQLKAILDLRPRVEKVAWKDVKLRTFITEDSSRDELVSHVYDITHGSVKPTDHLVAIDDSIVRGTTLKQSILRIFDRLSPKHIVIASSAPQIRYPDCYGIDMARMGDFVAFRAAIALLKERGKEGLIQEVYEKCKAQVHLADHEVKNFVKEIYEPFEAQEISDKIAELLTPPEVNAKVSVLYQTIEDLHLSCPGHPGDWYFTGDYPTPGGNRVVNKSFMYYVEGRTERAY